MVESEITYLFAAADQQHFQTLEMHMAPLCEGAGARQWHPGLTPPGKDSEVEVKRHLRASRIIAVLVSPAFLADKPCQRWLKSAVEEQQRRGLHLIPIWLRPVAQRPAELAGLQGLPGGEALSARKDRDAAWIEVAAGLGALLSGAAAEDDFLTAYRSCLRGLYDLWDLGAVSVTPGRQPVVVRLDDMYLPLRLGEGFDPGITDQGAVIPPDALLQRERPLVIRGAAGSGKTTWMRWTFRRLLELPALPIPLVLRDVARCWQELGCSGSRRSFEHYLTSWMAEHLPGHADQLLPRLGSRSGPRPILLIDGWDELGALGTEFREKLIGFMARHPRLMVVATSRPYGEGRPSQSDNFELLDIQPLSDAEIEAFAATFCLRCDAQDPRAAQEEVTRFKAALARAEEAQALARTALLLTMMLLISRVRRLPDKRHLLYKACIENLLTDLPARRGEAGAQEGKDTWCPKDGEERWRAVAALALALQEREYREADRATIVLSWDEMAALLPADWMARQRDGFLRWLSGPSGLLTDRADGTLA